MSCAHEGGDGHEHGHSHGHGHGHNHDDHLPPPSTLPSQTLYKQIDHGNITTLNEAVAGSGAHIVREYNERLKIDNYCESDVDEELLITIPFTALVRLHSILIRSFPDKRAPKTIKVFKNREGIDFAEASIAKPIQTLEHPYGIGVGTTENDGIVEYSMSRAQFSNITSVTLFVEKNHGDDTTALTYIGLRGLAKDLVRAPVVTLYEAAANPADHKNLLKQTNRIDETMD